MLVDFYVPNRLLELSLWYEWEPATGTIKFGYRDKPLRKAILEAVRDATDEQSNYFFAIEEENDRYHRPAPPHQIYTAWVEWFYRNRAYMTIRYRLTLSGTRRGNIGQLGRLRFLKGFSDYAYPMK
jgi:hypothetical protein